MNEGQKKIVELVLSGDYPSNEGLLPLSELVFLTLASYKIKELGPFVRSLHNRARFERHYKRSLSGKETFISLKGMVCCLDYGELYCLERFLASKLRLLSYGSCIASMRANQIIFLPQFEETFRLVRAHSIFQDPDSSIVIVQDAFAKKLSGWGIQDESGLIKLAVEAYKGVRFSSELFEQVCKQKLADNSKSVA